LLAQDGAAIAAGIYWPIQPGKRKGEQITLSGGQGREVSAIFDLCCVCVSRFFPILGRLVDAWYAAEQRLLDAEEAAAFLPSIARSWEAYGRERIDAAVADGRLPPITPLLDAAEGCGSGGRKRIRSDGGCMNIDTDGRRRLRRDGGQMCTWLGADKSLFCVGHFFGVSRGPPCHFDSAGELMSLGKRLWEARLGVLGF